MSWLERAKKVIPSASQTYSKSHYYYTKPFFAYYGEGGVLYGVDEYHDFNMALGANILGYKPISWYADIAPPSGINFSAPHILEVLLAEKLVSLIPSAEMVKFFKNGSDATEIAVRLARAFTGRDIVLAGGYHGFHDWYIGSTDKNKGVPDRNTYQFNDLESLNYLIRQLGDKIAAVIIEPTMAGLEFISQLTRENGSLIIFDEVLTGFRYHVKGLQHLFGITPNLSCFGKCMANGLPLSAVVGRADIMQLMDGQGVFASSTFGGETLSLAASLKTIEELEKNGKHLWHVGGKWASEMDILIRKKGLTPIMQVVGLAPRSGVTFNNEGNVKAVEYQSLYQQELLKRKILTMGINNYCIDHTDEQIDYFIHMADEVLDILHQAYKDNNAERYLENGTIQTMFDRRQSNR